MCIVAIVDTNSLSLLTKRQEIGDKHFLEWIRRRHGILAFAFSGKYYDEIQNNRAVIELFKQYHGRGQLRIKSVNEVQQAEKQLVGKPYRSNDLHILSLALASEAKVLCSRDEYLRADFKNMQILPRLSRGPRVLYPLERDSNTRRQFINRHRCNQRQKK